MKRTVFMSGLLLVLIPCLLHAQQYPTKPVNILVGFVPGGAVDNASRLVASKAEKFLTQPFIISNNSGGGGSVGLGIIAKERPDGYHLAGTTSTILTIIPQLRAVPYRLEDFVLIMHYAAMQTGLVVREDSPWKTLKEFVEYAKTNPGKITYGSAGAGTTSQIAMEWFAKQEGIQWTHVPYPGVAPALAALMGGHITAVSGDTTWVPFVRAGSLRLLATHGEKRMKSFPNVPTFKDLGYDFINENVFIMAAPKGTPLSITKKLDEVFHKGTEDPEFIQAMAKIELEITYRNAEDTRKHIEATFARFKKIITDLKIPKEPEKKS